MSSPSNLYAEKVFSEHPLGLWSLDEDIPFLSLAGTYKDLQYWTVTGATVTLDTSLVSPVLNSKIYKVSGEGFDGTYPGQITVTTPNLFKFSELNKDLGTITISTYFYAESPKISKISFGYRYLDGSTPVDTLKEVTTISTGAWGLLSETFQIPDISQDISLIIKINYNEDETPGTQYNIFITSIVAGQFAEDANAVSSGASIIDIPNDIAISQTSGVKINAYGIQDTPGYFIVNNKTLYARNFGLPMVFGTGSGTTVYPNPSGPSIIVPGFGFLNKVGQYRDLTLEAWIKIESMATSPKRIIGPIASDDGLYVDGPFLTLKIGNVTGSHFMYEWGRPMLIHIRVVNNFASLLINGEQVLSLDIVTDSLSLPDQFDNYFSANRKEQDWIGIYSYDDINLFKIDAIAIYPYQVSEIIAKRRFIYGQAVDFPESVRSSASGSMMYIDYPFAEYTNNYSYPNFGKWNQGISENLKVDLNQISSPDYELPTVYLAHKKSSITGLTATTSSIVFTSENSFIPGELVNISSLIINDTNSSAYNLSNVEVVSSTQTTFTVANTTGIVSTYVSGGVATSVISQTTDNMLADLGDIQELETNKYLSLRPNQSWNNTAGYLLFSKMNLLYQPLKAFYGIFEVSELSENKQILFKVENETTRNYFEVSLADDTISYIISYGNLGNVIVHSVSGILANEKFSAGISINDFSRLFSNNLLSFFGDQSQLKVYVAGNKNLTSTFTGKIYNISFVTDKSFAEISDSFDANFVALSSETLLAYKASYSLIARYYFDQFVMDIETSSLWEDYLPLRYFAKYVKDARNQSYYDLDFLQFNVAYPESSIVGNSYSTDNNPVKTYISFQQIAEGSNKTISDFQSIQPASSTGTVDPGDEWVTTLYEVVDGMIIYPPSSVSINDLAIVTHIDIKNSSSIRKPIKIKSLEYASESFDDLSPNPVGTRFGIPIYPYTRLGVYLDYKRKNPFTIYKGSTPYLYLTKNSGIRLRGTYGQPASRGLATKINQSKSEGYLLNGVQLSLKYDQPLFPLAPVELLEIEGADSQIRIYVQASNESRTRGKIYALDTIAGALDDSVVFYINGIPTKNPNINIHEWAMLGIQFTGKLNFDSYAGELRITGPAIVNNVSYYQYDQNRQAQTITFREWINVLYSETATLDWDYWNATPSIQWRGVLYILSTKTYDIDLSQIFKTYVGTNRFIFTNPNVLSLQGYKYSIYNNVVWQTKTLSAV